MGKRAERGRSRGLWISLMLHAPSLSRMDSSRVEQRRRRHAAWMISAANVSSTGAAGRDGEEGGAGTFAGSLDFFDVTRAVFEPDGLFEGGTTAEAPCGVDDFGGERFFYGGRGSRWGRGRSGDVRGVSGFL